MRFDKPPLTYEQQLDQLIQRGMQCTDRNKALHYLAHLNYYRLVAYWRPFEKGDADHRFQPDVSFDNALNLYVFDRELRLLVMDAIERIEVSVRTAWAYHLSHEYGPHAHLDPEHFRNHHQSGWVYPQAFEKLKAETRRSRERFVVHLRNKYSEPVPPTWAVVEIMTIGQLSKWVGNLKLRRDRNAIARCYDMDERIFCSFLHHLTIVRNTCAHHARLWNRDFNLVFGLPSGRPTIVVSSFHSGDKRVYNTLVMLAYLMDVISRHHHWKHRLRDLIEKHRINTRAMGFPENFEVLDIWSGVWNQS